MIIDENLIKTSLRNLQLVLNKGIMNGGLTLDDTTAAVDGLRTLNKFINDQFSQKRIPAELNGTQEAQNETVQGDPSGDE